MNDNKFSYAIGTPLACYEDEHMDKRIPIFGSITKVYLNKDNEPYYSVLWCDEQFEMKYSEHSIKEFLSVLNEHMNEI